MATFADALREGLEESGKRRASFARDVGISATEIARYLKSGREPNLQRTIALARAVPAVRRWLEAEIAR